jgi:hypothetical protein
MSDEEVFAPINYLIEREPIDRGQTHGCWCPDSFIDAGLAVAYCPRHGSEPDPELR